MSTKINPTLVSDISGYSYSKTNIPMPLQWQPVIGMSLRIPLA
jgi:hypothetical protein